MPLVPDLDAFARKSTSGMLVVAGCSFVEVAVVAVVARSSGKRLHSQGERWCSRSRALAWNYHNP